jgi:hypothetical protein
MQINNTYEGKKYIYRLNILYMLNDEADPFSERLFRRESSPSTPTEAQPIPEVAGTHSSGGQRSSGSPSPSSGSIVLLPSPNVVSFP